MSLTAVAVVPSLIVYASISAKYRRLERELMRSKDRFQAAVRAVHGVHWTNDSSGRMNGEQPGWSALTGQSFDEYQGFGWVEAVHPDDRRASLDSWNETVREKRMYVFEHRVRARDGSWRNFAIRAVPIMKADGSIGEWVGVHSDITEQRKAEAERQAAEDRFHVAVRAVRGIMWTTNAEGIFVCEQPGWAAITGQTYAEYRGDGWSAAIHPDDVQATIATWSRSVATGDLYAIEHRVRVKDGGWRHFAARGLPVHDANGVIQEWVGVHADITEQREAERELRESNDELQRYAYIVSHDLRAPLVNVIGFTRELETIRADLHVALADHPDARTIDSDLGEAIGFIKAAVARMEGLIAAILKLSREGRRTFRSEPLNLVVLLRTLANAQRHQTLAKGATVDIDQSIIDITADSLAVEQIFANLIDNAIKYLQPGRSGRISIVTEDVGPRYVRIGVRDNGRGIAERDHARIFELFRRSGVQDQVGEGIGLAHVKALVKALGGRIEVSSVVGVGSTFSVVLPRSPVSEAASHPSGAGLMSIAAE